MESTPRQFSLVSYGLPSQAGASFHSPLFCGTGLPTASRGSRCPHIGMSGHFCFSLSFLVMLSVLPLCSLSLNDLLLQGALCQSCGEGGVSLAELLALSDREVSFAKPLSAETVAGKCMGSVQPGLQLRVALQGVVTPSLTVSLAALEGFSDGPCSCWSSPEFFPLSCKLSRWRQGSS